MLTSYLKSGQTVDFAIDNTRGVAFFGVEMLMTGPSQERIGTIKLTPLEALTLADHMKLVADYACGIRDNAYTASTQDIQEEESLLNLHPRSAALLANADLNPATGEHNAESSRRQTPIPSTLLSDAQADDESEGRDGGRSHGRDRDGRQTDRAVREIDPELHGDERDALLAPAQSADHQTGSQSMAEGVDVGQADAVDQAGQPELQTSPSLIVDSQGHVAKDNANHGAAPAVAVPFGWDKVEGGAEADDFYREFNERPYHEEDRGTPIYPESPTMPASKGFSAALTNDALTNADDAWADSVDWFVDAIQLDIDFVRLEPDANTMLMEVIQTEAGFPDARMPLTLTMRKALIKSSAVRQLIEEVFAQAFRYGASWENCNERN